MISVRLRTSNQSPSSHLHGLLHGLILADSTAWQFAELLVGRPRSERQLWSFGDSMCRPQPRIGLDLDQCPHLEEKDTREAWRSAAQRGTARLKAALRQLLLLVPGSGMPHAIVDDSQQLQPDQLHLRRAGRPS